MARRHQCLLCGVELQEIDGSTGLQAHPPTEDCRVLYTDSFGVAVGEESATQILSETKPEDSQIVDVRLFPPVSDVIAETFDSFGLPFLGGMSSGRGWSSFSLWQKCPYAWKRRYIDHARPWILVDESPALAIGTLTHVFLALHYSRLLADSKYRDIDLVELHDRIKRRANPEFVAEAWRIFDGYRRYYAYEEIIPLAIEYDLRDPRTGESCRFDLIAYHESELGGRIPGTYCYEHKTLGIFTRDNLESWANDGEVIGEYALWKRLGLDNRFGELKGIIVNILGKQPVNPQYHRTIIAPSQALIDQHLQDLKSWEGLIQLAKSTNSFPRARANCIGRYGRCSEWEHCASAGK